MTDSDNLPEKPEAEAPPEANKAADWRFRWHEIIFEADTPKGKAFDVGLLIAIGPVLPGRMIQNSIQA